MRGTSGRESERRNFLRIVSLVTKSDIRVFCSLVRRGAGVHKNVSDNVLENMLVAAFFHEDQERRALMQNGNNLVPLLN